MSAQINTPHDLSPSTVHPLAAHACPEEFWYDSVKDDGPFGTDRGLMVLSDFIEWRKQNRFGRCRAFAGIWLDQLVPPEGEEAPEMDIEEAAKKYA